MQVTTETNPQKGPGYAIFTLQRADGSAFPPVADGPALILQSSSTRSYWSAGKWVQGKAAFTPDELKATGTILQVFLGPDIIDQLDPVETYQLCVAGSNGTEYCGVFYLDNVEFSPVRGAHAPEAPQQAVQQEASVPLFPTGQPEEPEPEPTVSIPEFPPAAPEDSTLKLPQEDQTPTGKTSSQKMYILAGLGGILLIGAIIAFFVMRNPAGTEQPPTAEAVTLESVRKMLADNTAKDRLLEAFSKTKWTAANADARFLLADPLAEQHANGPAMLALAQFYDPSWTDTPSGSIVKDGALAYTWYAAAKKAGTEGVDKRLAALLAWAKKEAEAGNTDAADLAKQMEGK